MSLSFYHLSFSFGNNLILKDVSFTLPNKTVAVLIGSNGSGKTTLFNLLCGFIPLKSGDIVIDGQPICNLHPYEISRLGLTRSFQDMKIVKSLSVKDNVMISFQRLRGEHWYKSLFPIRSITDEENRCSFEADRILKECFIIDVADRLADEISYGQQKLLNLACCIASDKQIWLLDEPAAGINPAYRNKIAMVIIEEKKKGKSMLIIEHNSDFIDKVADNILHLHDGILDLFPSYEAYANCQKFC